MIENPDKLHLLLSDRNIHWVDICNGKLSSAYSEKLLLIDLSGFQSIGLDVSQSMPKQPHYYIHERALIIYQSYNSSFTELLWSDSSLAIHQGNWKL